MGWWWRRRTRKGQLRSLVGVFPRVNLNCRPPPPREASRKAQKNKRKYCGTRLQTSRKLQLTRPLLLYYNYHVFWLTKTVFVGRRFCKRLHVSGDWAEPPAESPGTSLSVCVCVMFYKVLYMRVRLGGVCLCEALCPACRRRRRRQQNVCMPRRLVVVCCRRCCWELELLGFHLSLGAAYA